MKRLIRFFETIQKEVPKLATEAIDATKEQFLHLNREQLLEGKTSKGDDMPSYFNDPYFKTREAAQRYSDWKDKITPIPKRRKGISNLYIIGTFHEGMFINVEGPKLTVGGTFKAAEIEAKNPDIYGLNSEKKRIYVEEALKPELINKIITNFKTISKS